MSFIANTVFFGYVVSGVLASVYNSEVFTINPHGERITFEYKDNKYILYNAGLVPLEAKIIWGDDFAWRSSIVNYDLQPGEGKVVHINPDYYYIAVKGVNYHNRRGLLYAFAVQRGYSEYDGSSPSFDFDYSTLALLITATGVAHVPFAGDALVVATNFFWPKNEPSVWDQVQSQVVSAITNKITETVKNTLRRELSYFRFRIQNVAREVDNPNITRTTGKHYANIAEDLIGLERKFADDDIDLNFAILPLFSALVNLKMVFYEFGLNHPDKIGLDEEFNYRLQYYMYELIHDFEYGAIKHIEDTCEAKLNKVYDETYSEVLFDETNNVYEYCALNGREYYAKWKQLVVDPKSKEKPINNAIFYSSQFGRNTARQLYNMLNHTSEAMNPKIVDGKINKISKVTVFLYDDKYIGGFKITYKNNDEAEFGPTTSGNSKEIAFDDKKLVKLEAQGSGRINYLNFIFNDNSTEEVGTAEGTKHVFGLPCHQIVGFFGTHSEIRIPTGQLANLFVTYNADDESCDENDKKDK